VKKTPKTFIMHGRNPKYDCKLDGKHIYFDTGTETTSTVDLENGEWRPSTKNDLEKLTRLIDALESLNLVGTITTSMDKPANVRCLHDYEAVLNNTEKPCGFNLYPPDCSGGKRKKIEAETFNRRLLYHRVPTQTRGSVR